MFLLDFSDISVPLVSLDFRHGGYPVAILERCVALEKLSKRTVDALQPEARAYFVYDTELTGFGVRVGPTGAKSWIFEYRPGAGGRTAPKRRVTLGSTLKLTPDQARKQARDSLAKVQLGADPAALRRVEREASTLGHIIDGYLENEVGPKLAKGTAALYAIYLNKHVRPVLGSRKADAITHADLAKLHRDIGRTRKTTANRTITVLSAMFGYAAKTGSVPVGFNPAKGIENFKETARERYLTAEELQRLGASLRLAETTGLPWETDDAKPTGKHAPKPENRIEVFSPHVTGAIRLLLFTGCRLREILHLRWTEIDFERGLLFLPTSKTGKKTVVLGAPALEILATLPRISEFVVAGQKPDTPRADLKKPWDRITKHAGLYPLRIHDLRHSFASIGAGAGMGLPIVGKLLGHAQPATTARYAHLDADPLRRGRERNRVHDRRSIGFKEMSNDKDPGAPEADSPEDAIKLNITVKSGNTLSIIEYISAFITKLEKENPAKDGKKHIKKYNEMIGVAKDEFNWLKKNLWILHDDMRNHRAGSLESSILVLDLIDRAFSLGTMFASDDATKEIQRRRQVEGGNARAKYRREQAKAWRDYALKFETEIRLEKPTLSKDDMATAILAKWDPKTKLLKPKHGTLRAFLASPRKK